MPINSNDGSDYNGERDTQQHTQPPVKDDRDPFRETYYRYLGYANELGEAFRSFIHVNAVRLSYGVASAYVVGDAIHKGGLAHSKFKDESDRTKLVCQSVVDTLLWQGLASVIIPGITINRLCWLSGRVLSARLPLTASKSLSTAIGLAAIPFIIKPIDSGVDELMNSTFRQWVSHMDELDRNIVHHQRDD